MSPVISKRTARWLLDALESSAKASVVIPQGTSDALQELRRALKVKRSVRVAAVERKKKKASKRVETSAIWNAVMKRADGRCEACNAAFSDFNAATMDHFFGRKNAPQSEKNCWALGWVCCHQAKTTTDNPSDWLRWFIRHAKFYGYSLEERRARAKLEAIQLAAASEAAGAEQETGR